VPDIDVTENSAPVINDVLFMIIMLIGMIVWSMKANIIDIETAFLHGDLEEGAFLGDTKWHGSGQL
jgi:hypothetical protein